MSRDVTFERFVTTRWAPFLERTKSAATRRAYVNVIRRHAASLMDLPLRTITTARLQEMLQRISDGDPSPSAPWSVECALASVFRLAVDEGAIAVNPMGGVRRHRHTEQPFEPFTDDQLRRIEDCLPYYPGANIFGTALHSDLPRGQLLGISTQGFTCLIGQGKVRVTHAVREDGHYGSTVSPLPGGAVELRVSSKACGYLEREHHSLAAKASAREFCNESRLLFVDGTGAPVSLVDLGRASRAIREMSGVPTFCLKNLRRTYRLRKDSSEVL